MTLAEELLKDIEAVDNIRYTPHPGQQPFHESKARFRILAAGRRFGKSLAACYEAIHTSIVQPGSITWIISPTYAQSMLSFRTVKRFLPQSQVKGDYHNTERFCELTNGSEIWFKSADLPDNLRGSGLNLVILDECAMIKKEAWEEVIRPSLSDKKGRAVMISTPKSNNWFHDLFVRGQDPLYPDYESWQFRTIDNPYIDESEVDEARKTLPDLVFRQEFLSEFVDDVGSVFRGVKSCIKGSLHDPVPGERYVMGADLAKYSDHTVLCILNQKGELCAFDRFSRIDWAFQIERIKILANKYRAKIIIDSTGVGDPIFESLKRSGQVRVDPYHFTSESKKQLIEGLSLAIEQQHVSYPDIPELINELSLYGYDIGSTGNVRYNAPGSGHDDCVVSLALAYFGMKYIKTYTAPVLPAPSFAIGMSHPGHRI